MPYFKSEVALLFLALHGITVDRSYLIRVIVEVHITSIIYHSEIFQSPKWGIKSTRPSMIASETFYNRKVN